MRNRLMRLYYKIRYNILQLIGFRYFMFVSCDDRDLNVQFWKFKPLISNGVYLWHVFEKKSSIVLIGSNYFKINKVDVSCRQHDYTISVTTDNGIKEETFKYEANIQK